MNTSTVFSVKKLVKIMKYLCCHTVNYRYTIIIKVDTNIIPINVRRTVKISHTDKMDIQTNMIMD